MSITKRADARIPQSAIKAVEDAKANKIVNPLIEITTKGLLFDVKSEERILERDLEKEEKYKNSNPQQRVYKHWAQGFTVGTLKIEWLQVKRDAAEDNGDELYFQHNVIPAIDGSNHTKDDVSNKESSEFTLVNSVVESAYYYNFYAEGYNRFMGNKKAPDSLFLKSENLPDEKKSIKVSAHLTKISMEQLLKPELNKELYKVYDAQNAENSLIKVEALGGFINKVEIPLQNFIPANSREIVGGNVTFIESLIGIDMLETTWLPVVTIPQNPVGFFQDIKNLVIWSIYTRFVTKFIEHLFKTNILPWNESIEKYEYRAATGIDIHSLNIVYLAYGYTGGTYPSMSDVSVSKEGTIIGNPIAWVRLNGQAYYGSGLYYSKVYNSGGWLSAGCTWPEYLPNRLTIVTPGQIPAGNAPITPENFTPNQNPGNSNLF